MEFATPIQGAPLAIGYKAAATLIFGRTKRQRAHVALFQWSGREWQLVKLLSAPIAVPTTVDAKMFRAADDAARELAIPNGDRYLDGERHSFNLF